MEKRFDRLEDKIDQIQADVSEIKIGYKEHERRSLANEASVEILRNEFRPMHDLLLQVRLIHRILICFAAVVAFVASVAEIISRLK